MKISKTLVGLSALLIVLALVAASVGLFWQDSGDSFPFATLHGQEVQFTEEVENLSILDRPVAWTQRKRKPTSIRSPCSRRMLMVSAISARPAMKLLPLKC